MAERSLLNSIPWKISTQENNYLCEGVNYEEVTMLLSADIPRNRLGESLWPNKRLHIAVVELIEESTKAKLYVSSTATAYAPPRPNSIFTQSRKAACLQRRLGNINQQSH